MRTPKDAAAGTYRFAVEEEVRFRDLDALGHVNNAVYLTYFEHARVGYFRHLGLVPQAVTGWSFILAEARCTYRSPARLGERLRIATGVTEMGRSSFRMGYCITHAGDGRLIATGDTVLVAYDYQAQRPVPVPGAARHLIAQWEGRPEWAAPPSPAGNGPSSPATSCATCP